MADPTAVSALSLAGKVALVAGGAGAMGAAVAGRMAAAGAAVAVADYRLPAAQEVATALAKEGTRAVALHLDVTDAASWHHAVEQTEAELGSLTTLCYLAGANRRVSYDEMTEEMFRQILDSNLVGNFLGIKAAVPALRRAGGGCIINVGSLASLRAGASPAYSASKFGVNALTMATAKAYAGDGIRCCQVNPGHVDTPFIRASAEHSPNDWSTSIDNPDNYQRRLSQVPLGRLQTPQDIAGAFVFLASDHASMVTGSAITVDGGAALG